ncbi:hypothetical protein OH76DRAFT_554832 [Lentinus brumalis]|uniref:Uncharacterized protein n=1 Tax=Lentinus brumalis TaxID=2498619 RepID=A0A371D980_9APHY|nr:hypothetical protein OH76DRAFT_554832 [Polyporus brumalis]
MAPGNYSRLRILISGPFLESCRQLCANLRPLTHHGLKMTLTWDEVGETVAACRCRVRNVLEARASFAEQPSSPFCLPLPPTCLDASSTALPRRNTSGWLTLCSKFMRPHTPAASGWHTRCMCESLLSHPCTALRRAMLSFPLFYASLRPLAPGTTTPASTPTSPLSVARPLSILQKSAYRVWILQSA